MEVVGRIYKSLENSLRSKNQIQITWVVEQGEKGFRFDWAQFHVQGHADGR